jgi:hypothetical protein
VTKVIVVIGERVEAHPATDSWMSGDRFGTVEKIGRKYIHVKMDRSGRIRKFTPNNVLTLSHPQQILGADGYYV